jgi:hypothetical protein
MPSVALRWWKSEAQATLDDLVSVHSTVGGTGPGRRYATEQINNAYAVLLSSQFQKFCRDLHSESADHVARVVPESIRAIVLSRFTDSRKLETGNPNPGNLGADFGRFGLPFWDSVRTAHSLNESRKRKLEQLNFWRNAISHHDFSRPEFRGRTAVTLKEVRNWRAACNGLAIDFDAILNKNLASLTGAVPW